MFYMCVKTEKSPPKKKSKHFQTFHKKICVENPIVEAKLFLDKSESVRVKNGVLRARSVGIAL